MEKPEIIVIGAGLGGLAAATLLARQGHSVRVVEQAEHEGGRARSRTERGFTHNLGAHALYQGGSAMQVLAALGVQPSGRLVRGEGSYVLQDDRLCALPRNAWTLLSTDALSARGKLFFAKLMAMAGERMAQGLRGQTVRQWLDAAAPDQGAAKMVEMFVRLTTYAHAPELLGAEHAVRQLAQAVRSSVMYIDGGWQSLVDAVSRRASEAGVRIELGCGAERIEHDGLVRAVRLQDGRVLPAAAVIAAIAPGPLASLLPNDAHARLCAEACVPLRAACLDLGVEPLPHPERLNVQSADAPMYFSNHSAFARLAPDGKHALHMVRYLAPGEDGRELEPELRALLERIQPGAYARAEVKRFMPNLIVHNDVPCAGRVALEHPEIAGLYRAGDTVSTRGMLLDGVLDSARGAAERVRAQLGAKTRAPLSSVGSAREAGFAA